MKSLDTFKKKLQSLPDIKQKMLACEQVECPVTNHFAEGQYVRECLMPSGAIVLGKKHKHSTVNILLKGKLLIYNGENTELSELSAPCVYTTEAGIQKLAYIIEDVTWLNCHPTKETDLEKIEAEFTEEEKRVELCHG